PDSSVGREFLRDIQAFDPATVWALADTVISIDDACSIVSSHMESSVKSKGLQIEEDDEIKCQRIWDSLGLADFDPSRPIRRWELAVLLDKYYDAFNRKNPDLRGRWKK
ncbi:MAG TPA: hypothetical protein VK543_07470, partial [Puia sp.]|nr:hypothetical protein [Puia sp.]